MGLERDMAVTAFARWDVIRVLLVEVGLCAVGLLSGKIVSL